MRDQEKEKRLKVVANALDIDFLKFDDLEVDLLEVEEDEFGDCFIQLPDELLEESTDEKLNLKYFENHIIDRYIKKEI